MQLLDESTSANEYYKTILLTFNFDDFERRIEFTFFSLFRRIVVDVMDDALNLNAEHINLCTARRIKQVASQSDLKSMR